MHRTDVQVETLWVAGGLYGNPLALDRLRELYEREPGAKALVFNGDFHWFDTEDFIEIDDAVRGHLATRGNVETELATPLEGAGCGCAYPDWVDDGTVERSNRIIERLRGAAESLAGWGFSQETLATPEGRAAAVAAFDRSKARIFASSHTCLPVLQCFPGGGVVVNNGAAGMPNFGGTRFGLATRISVFRGERAVYSERAAGLFVEAVALDYDAQAWERRFLAQWPAGSAAHRSYFERLVSGPRYSVGQALRRTAALAA